jgi:hydroxylamine reductase (hybrid-cluster protein)
MKDMNNKDEVYNIVESMAKAKQLYKELIIQAHPDKHPEKVESAEQITAQINENKYNYRELVKIKETINQILLD